jgi:hypothetical protein
MSNRRADARERLACPLSGALNARHRPFKLKIDERFSLSLTIPHWEIAALHREVARNVRPSCKLDPNGNVPSHQDLQRDMLR